jgi:hypothetical protein
LDAFIPHILVKIVENDSRRVFQIEETREFLKEEVFDAEGNKMEENESEI